MTNRILILVGVLLISCVLGCNTDKYEGIEPVNPNTTKEGRELLSYLYTLKGERILTGQHNYGNELLRSTDSVRSMTGKFPAVWGSDMLPLGNGQRDTGQEVIDEAIRQHSKGSIITLMYHQVKPFDHDSLGFSRSVKGRVTDEEWNQIITPGTAYYDMLIEKIDRVAYYLKQLQEKRIPVLWRPYHEMNGIWFWYGDRKGENGFEQLWKIMYDRYTQHHQLNNLIWVWNANGPRDWENDQAYDYHLYFPGTEYVDILAADIYKNDYKQSHHDQLLELGGGKLLALGECGVMPTPETLQAQSEWSWFMTWANFIWKVNDPADVKRLYNWENALTLDEIEKIQ